MGVMGLFRTTIELENLERRGTRHAIPDALVDTGSEFTWAPRPVLESLGIIAQRKQVFIVADRRRVERDIGYALVRAGGSGAERAGSGGAGDRGEGCMNPLNRSVGQNALR